MSTETQEQVGLAPIVERYMKLREKKAELKKAYEASVEDIDIALERVENFLLAKMQELGVESVRTPFGTPYISKRTSVTTADRQMFLDFVKDHGEWDMLEVRPAKTIVVAWREEHNDLPPGLNWTEERVVNIRKS